MASARSSGMASSPEKSSSLLVRPKPNSSAGGITSGMSVTTPPGDRALQRMPSSIYMNAVFFVTARTAPLLAQ